jgi:hypothetical protein
MTPLRADHGAMAELDLSTCHNLLTVDLTYQREAAR